MKAQLQKFQHKIVKKISIPAQPGIYKPFPKNLSPQLQSYLEQQNIHELYLHQYQMFTHAMNKQNVIITTATASGKTLSFLLPVIQSILENPSKRAVFVYPTKALAQDQLRNMNSLLSYFGCDQLQAGVYDGDTTASERKRIRREANLILTNPEMLHGTFLPNHSRYGFNSILSKLSFLVIDELHVYRGAFGSHMSNVMRRFLRLCKYYQSSPQFLLSSATIANPIELAENICHKKFVHVCKSGAPLYAKEILLWQPPFVADSTYRKTPEEEAAQLIPNFVSTNERFLAFCRSRRQVEVVLKETRDQLTSVGKKNRNFADKISGYRGGYTKEERQNIEKRLATKNLCGVVSTNALELGIDIGDIDTVLLCGFPATRASFWQQAGRAGRKSEATVILFLDVNSVDQYITIHPEYLTNRSVENAIIDKNNLFIQLAHIRAAAAEIPITLEDASIFPDIGEVIPVLLQAQELKSEHGNFHWTGSQYPAGEFSLRSISKETYKIILSASGKMITEMDETQAFREAYPKAIYLHDGFQYMVENFDKENRLIHVFATDVNYFTVPFVETDVRVLRKFRNQALANTIVTFGDVKVGETVVAYKMMQFHNHQNLGYETIPIDLIQKLETEAIWFQIPTNVVHVFEAQTNHNFYSGIQHVLLRATMIRTMATREDINATFFTDSNSYHILLYDLYPSGLGFTEKAFDYTQEILEQAAELLKSCTCKCGCPACVGDYFLDKKVVQWGIDNMLQPISELPNISNLITQQPIPEKNFRLQDFPQKWDSLIKIITQRSEPIGEFLTKVEKVKCDHADLSLFVASNFLCEWALEKSNKAKIEKILSRYIEGIFSIQIKSSKNNQKTIEKIMNRYDDLKKQN